MEVIVAGYLEYDALLPALIAAYTASFTSHFLGLEKFAVDIQDTWTVTDLRSMISLIALGLAFGLAGRCFSVLLQKAKKLFGEKISNPLIRIGDMAIPLAALLFVIHGGRLHADDRSRIHRQGLGCLGQLRHPLLPGTPRDRYF